MDTRLRSLERAAALGDEDAKVGLLVHRVRAHEIPARRVEMAAYLGDAVALQARGLLGYETSKYPRRWLRGLGKFGEDVALRILIICHDVLIHGSPNIMANKGSKRSYNNVRYMNFGHMELVFNAVKEWEADPTEDRRDWVIAQNEQYNLWRSELHPWDARRIPEHRLLCAINKTCQVNIEQAFKTTCEFRSPTFSKWGAQQVEMVLKCLIAGDLIRWALKRAS